MNIIQRRNDAFDPFEVLKDFQTDLDRFFAAAPVASKNWPTSMVPEVEVLEKDQEYIVHADLPGMKREDFDITVEGNRFVLRGNRKEETQSDKKGYHYSERRYGSFARSFALPAEIDAEKVKASYKNGVLEVSLPKAAKEKTKKIEVQVN